MLPSKYSTLEQAIAVSYCGAKCKCGADVKIAQLHGEYWLLCMKHEAHRGLSIKAEAGHLYAEKEAIPCAQKNI